MIEELRRKTAGADDSTMGIYKISLFTPPSEPVQ